MNDDLANALAAAANNASAMESLCDANGDDDGATKANAAYNQLSAAAMTANANNAIQVLGTTAAAQRQLSVLTGQMDAATKQLAQDQANVNKFVSLGTQAAKLATALATVPPNLAAGVAAIAAMTSALNLH